MRVLLIAAALLLFVAVPVLAVPPQGGPYYHCEATVQNGASASCTYAGHTFGGGASCGTTNCFAGYAHCEFGNGPGPTYAPRCT